MEQKLSDTLVKAIDRSNPMMQNLQLASRFNKLIDEGGGSADLEDDHATTIDVSAYTDPVEVTPAESKDGMKKNTITLTNIPQASMPLYAWKYPSWTVYVYTYTENPSVGDTVVGGDYGDVSSILNIIEDCITEVGENQITIASGGGLYDGTYERDSTKDVVLRG